MRSKTEGEIPARDVTPEGSEQSRREQMCEDLKARGVAPELCETLSACLDEDLTRHSPEAYQALLDGVVLACGVQTGVDRELTRNLRELRETERLMGAFANELSKLDEVLEVLAAHLNKAWFFFRADLFPGKAARMEAAPWGYVNRAGHFSGKNNLFPFTIGVGWQSS